MTGLLIFLGVAGIGGVAQLVDGSLGMGFGVFSASLMVAAGFAPAVAVAAVNAAKIITGLASGLSHWGLGNVRRDWLLPLALSGVLGGFLGGYLLTSISSETAKPAVSLLLLVMGLLIVWRALRWQVPCAAEAQGEKCKQCPRGKWQLLAENARNNSKAKLGALGFLAALVNGFSGAYGPIATSGVLLLEKGQPRYAIGTVNAAEFFVAITVTATILLRLGLGQFPIGLVLALATGGLMVAPLAAYICRGLSPKALAFLVGSLLIALNVRVISWLLA